MSLTHGGMDRRNRLNIDNRCIKRADELEPFQFVLAQDWITGEPRWEQVLDVQLVGDDVHLRLSRTPELWTSQGNTFITVPNQQPKEATK